ncbi:MAG: fumarylacetoacetate hydrolase family protein [Thalassobaculaceae bacterium]|nr:fumarylacetoacetate hydrolase family protein [Thalassobaculaceae bacterium]
MTSSFAAAMIDARSSNARISLPHVLPADRAAAFATQVETLDGMGLGVAGFKVGAQGRSGEPSAAPLASGTVFRDHTRIVSTRTHPLWLEAEVAMVVGRDLPCDHGTPEEEVLAAMEGLAAAIEIVEPRILEWPNIPPLAAMADFQANGGAVISAVGCPATGVNVEDLTVTFEMGAVHVEVQGKNYPGQDMNRLPTWLVNHMAGWGPEMAARGLKKGDVIITGSWVGVIPAEAGETATVTVPGIGSVSVEIAAE